MKIKCKSNQCSLLHDYIYEESVTGDTPTPSPALPRSPLASLLSACSAHFAVQLPDLVVADLCDQCGYEGYWFVMVTFIRSNYSYSEILLFYCTFNREVFHFERVKSLRHSHDYFCINAMLRAFLPHDYSNIPVRVLSGTSYFIFSV